MFLIEMINERLQRAIELHRQGQLAEAQRIYEEILRFQPAHFDVLNLLGVLSAQTRNYQRAIELIDRAIAIFPHHVDCYFNRGLARQALRQWEAAVASFDQAIALKPDHAEAWSNRGNALLELLQWSAAVDSYNKAIELKPDNAVACYKRGNALLELKKFDAAVTSFDRALTIRPEYAEAWYNRGVALYDLKQFDAAEASYDKAIAVKPDYSEAWYNRGNALLMLSQWDAAVASYDRAIAMMPGFTEAWSNRGNALKELRQLDDAILSYDRAIATNPEHAEAWSNRGNVLQELKKFDAAVESYDKAVTIRPEYAEAWSNRGNALMELKQLSSAAESYKRALLINPDGDYWSGTFLHLQMMVCDWSSYDNLRNRLVTKIENRERASTPFPVLTLIDEPGMIRQAATIYVEDKHPSRHVPQTDIKRPKRSKIRIGYYSADFHNHATMHLMAELFEKHDRSRFEIIAFSLGPGRQDDAMRQRAVQAFDRLIDVSALSDREVATLSGELEVDIAVDLKGFTKDARPGIFTFRPAPLQVSYLGYPGTMGVEFMDYLIADPTLVPQEYQRFYSEKIVYMPDCYQVNNTRRQIADRIFTREESGLPPAGFVFCCFNNNYKITPDIFDSWMRILKSAEGSVLWLFEDNPQAAGNLRREALRRGVDADRLVFAGRMPLPEHLARHRSADLFLDTLPYNAHTTASDALWAGLPVLTRIGESFAGRVAASLLNAVHLPELITSSQDEYEALAIELAADPEKLAGIKLKLENNRLSTPLFDSDLFARHIEVAYLEMYERYHLDLPPDHIYVKSDDPAMQM